MKIIMPPRNLLYLAVIVSLINPISYLLVPEILTSFEPFKNLAVGNVFNGFAGNDAVIFTLTNSYKWNFESPWSIRNEGTVFSNPYLTSPFIYVPLGILFYNIDAKIAVLITSFLLSVLYCIVIYNFFLFFLKNKEKTKIGYLFFLLSTSLGGIIFLAGVALKIDLFRLSELFAGGVISYESIEASGMHFFSQTARIYYFLPHITALLSILFFFKKKYALSGIFLGLTGLFHPLFGATYTIILIVLSIILRDKKIFISVLFSLPFAIPWLIAFFDYRGFFDAYLILQESRGLNDAALLVPFITSFFIYIVFSAFLIKGRTKLERKIYFVIIWFFIAAFLSLLINSKFLFFVRTPLIILATLGIFEFSKKYNMNVKKILAIILILSIPTIILYEFHRQAVLIRDPTSFYTQEDVNALTVLKPLPEGRVLASPDIGTYLPSYTNKRTLLINFQFHVTILNYTEKYNDYRMFYSNASEKEKYEILRKYDIKYIFFGNNEKNISAFNPDSLKFLEKIYDNVTKIYAVK